MLRLVSCGHPDPLLVSEGLVSSVPMASRLPLGLGEPAVWGEDVGGDGTVELLMARGDRVLLYTDGLIEARDARRRFVPLQGLSTAPVPPPGTEGPAVALDRARQGQHESASRPTSAWAKGPFLRRPRIRRATRGGGRAVAGVPNGVRSTPTAHSPRRTPRMPASRGTVDHGRLELAPVARSVPLARRWVADQLVDGPAADLVDDVELLTTEVVTNAVLHAGTAVTVTVSVTVSGVRVAVADGSRFSVVRRPPPSPTATTGRGSLLLDALAARWGSAAGTDGKVVWFELDLQQGRDGARGLGEELDDVG